MLDDNSGLHHQQELEQQWMEREYDIAFGSFARDFKLHVESQEKEKSKEMLYMGAFPEYGDN